MQTFPPTYLIHKSWSTMRAFVFPNKHLYPLCGICMWSKPQPTAPSSMTDCRKQFFRFPFCLSLCLAQRALWLDVLDVRAVRKWAIWMLGIQHKHKHAGLCCFNRVIMHVCKHGKESGRTMGKWVKRSLNFCGLVRVTFVHGYSCDDSNDIIW